LLAGQQLPIFMGEAQRERSRVASLAELLRMIMSSVIPSPVLRYFYPNAVTQIHDL